MILGSKTQTHTNNNQDTKKNKHKTTHKTTHPCETNAPSLKNPSNHTSV